MNMIRNTNEAEVAEAFRRLGPGWLTNEVLYAHLPEINERTIRHHVLLLIRAGLVEQVEGHPGNMYRWVGRKEYERALDTYLSMRKALPHIVQDLQGHKFVFRGREIAATEGRSLMAYLVDDGSLILYAPMFPDYWVFESLYALASDPETDPKFFRKIAKALDKLGLLPDPLPAQEETS